MPGRFLLKYRWWTITIFLLALLLAISNLYQMEISQKFENYFPKNDPDLKLHRWVTTQLGDEDALLTIAVYREKGIFDSLFLTDFHQLTLELERLEYVLRAQSLTRLHNIRRTPFGLTQSPFLHIRQPDRYLQDSLALLSDSRLLNRFVDGELKTLTILLEIEKGLSGRQAEQLISAIERKGREYGFDAFYLMGRTYLEVSFNRVSGRELIKSLLICIGLIILVLSFLYRSFWAVLIPLIIYLASIIFFLGVMILNGHKLDAMSNLAPAILLIVSISDVIHFFSHYELQIKKGLARKEALQHTISQIGLALFLTSFTTSVGFLTLAASDLPTLKYLGADIAIGVMIAYLTTMILLPFSILLIPPRAFRLWSGWPRLWKPLSAAILRQVQFRGSRILRISLLLTAAGITGSLLVSTNNHLTDVLPRKDAFVRSAIFFSEQLGGARSFELLVFPQVQRTLSELAVIKEIEKLDHYLDSFPHISGLYSPAIYYKSMNMAWHGGSRTAYALPASQQQLEVETRKMEAHPNTFQQAIMNEDRSLGRVNARMQDLGRQRVYAFNDQVNEWIPAHIDTSLIRTRILGSSGMFDKIQEHAIRNMVIGLLIAIGVVGLLTLVLFHRWDLMLTVILVNMLPLLLTGAVMALLGIELRYGTSVIFPIGFVIAVDDTIHFVSRYQLERRDGKPVWDALSTTLRETGRAMLLTSVILFLGFFQLVFSSFPDAQATGILVSTMLVFALMADVFLAAVLILWWEKKKEKTRIRSAG